MPRDGSGIYTTPPGTTAVPDTTIESAKYNANVADVAADLNAPRPIVAGGTGGNSAATARTNLGAEAAGIQVTNYDTHVFENGSFWSDGTATARPASAGGMAGWCSRRVGGGNEIVIEAREMIGGKAWVRTNVSGAWGTWLEQSGSVTDTDARYVNVTGDTMTGQLSIGPAAADAILALNAPVGSNANITLHYTGARGTKVNDIWFYAASKPLWTMRVADDFVMYRYNDAGTYLDNALVINRATANMTLSGDLSISKPSPALFLDFVTNPGGVGGRQSGVRRWLMVPGGPEDFYIYRYNNSGGPADIIDAPLQISRATGAATFSGALTVNGGANVSGALIGSTTVAGNPLVVRENTQPSVWLQNAAGTNYVQIYHYIPNGRSGIIYNDANKQFAMEYNGYVNLGVGMNSRAGINGTFNSPNAAFNTCWTGGVLQVWVDATLMGNMSWTSDYRIKKDVVDLTSTWEAVRALRPVQYTQAQYTPQPEKKRKLEDALKAREMELDVPQAKEGSEFEPMFAANDAKQWGFIAHEVQETLLPTAAVGVKDQEDCIQSLNVGPIVAALTKALQEAMARIEALEAAASVPVR